MYSICQKSVAGTKLFYKNDFSPLKITGGIKTYFS